MKTIEQLKLELNQARERVSAILQEIAGTPDGYTYQVCVRSYGSKSWETPVNTVRIQDLADEYGDGYDGLVDVYTDNPLLEINHWGCLSIYTLNELPEDVRGVSKSEAVLRFIRGRYDMMP